MVKDPEQRGEFSRLVAADRLGDAEVTREIEAAPAERAAVARRLGLLALDSLTARVELRRLRGGLVRVAGRVEAAVVQACVVTLEPVPARVAADFAAIYAAGPVAEERVANVAADAEDPPEPMVDGKIDLGETAVQQLAVALEPYPRSPGAEVPAEYAGADADDGRPGGPFAALAGLKDGR
jgi:uncharacterized metal-binding protein YceD (DUF177 family)